MKTRTIYPNGPIDVDLVALVDRVRRLEYELGSARTRSSTPWFRRGANRKVFALTFLVAALTSTVLYGQNAVDALVIDKSGVTIGKNVTASSFTTSTGFRLPLVPVGTIMAFGGNTRDASVEGALRSQGWLVCDGHPVSTKDYAALFAAIGAGFGASNAEQFNLPDFRGRFLRGVDNGIGRDKEAAKREPPTTKGGNSGDAVGSVQLDTVGQHAHLIDAQHNGGDNGKSDGDPIAVAGWPRHYALKSTRQAGGSETRPTNIYANWIIYAGLK